MSSKKVQVKVTQGSSFKTECRAGKHLVVIDQPANGGGTDAGPTPLDIQLMALGGCITAIGRIIAMQRRLDVRGIEIELEGELDTDCLLGKSQNVRAGFSAITARVRIDSDLGLEEKQRFLDEVERRCPISDNLQNLTPVRLVIES